MSDKMDLDSIERRHNAATAGEWVANDTGTIWVGDSEVWIGDVDPVSSNGEFIAHAHQDVPALVAEVRRLRAALEELHENGTSPEDRYVAGMALKNI